MADLAVWQRTIVDEEGNIVPGAEVEVRREEDGSLATLYADRAGETPLANPLAADMSGFVRFFAQGDAYTITAVGAGSTRTWRFDPTGRLQEFDRVSDALAVDDGADTAEARSLLGTFSTVAEVQSRHIPPVLDSIRTEGHYSPGDGGGALYKRVTTEPDHAGKIQSADGAWWVIAESVLNIRQFGAKGDYDPENRTGTDDTAAFNAASALIREALRSSNKNKLTDRVIVIPPGNYLVTSVDFTDLRATAQLGQTCTVLGYGAHLYCKTPGAVAVDLTNSLGISLEGLAVIGDELSPPRVGIQLARGITGLSAGRHRLQSVVVAGHYTLSSVYNFASEREHVSDCQFTNNYPSTTAYAYALDGVNWHEATSVYFQPEQPKYTPQSNLSHYFEQTTFSKGQGTPGSPIWLCRFGRLRMVNCYAVTRDDYGVIIETDQALVEGCYLDLHIEMVGSKGSIKFVPLDPDNINTNRRIRIDNFTFLENTIHGNEAVLRASAGDEIILRNANISVLNERPDNAGQYNFAVPLAAFQILNGNVQMAVGQNDYGFPNGTYNIIHGNTAYTKGSGVYVSRRDTNFNTGNVGNLDKAEFKNGNVHVDFSGTGTAPLVVTRNGEEKFTINVTDNGERVSFTMNRGSPNERVPLVFRQGGALGIPRMSSPPSNATGGDIYYDVSLHKLRVYVGGPSPQWVDLN